MAKKKQPVRKAPVKRKTIKAEEAVMVVDNSVAAVRETSLSLNNMKEIMSFGKVLKSYITENNLSVDIAGKQYAMVDGWKFAGANFGLTAIAGKPKSVHEKGQYVTTLYKEIEKKGNNGTPYKKEVAFFMGFTADEDTINSMRAANQVTREMTRPYFAYECETDILRLSDGKIIGHGTALCTNLESKKADFDEYSVHSMSQTRSIGKGYRNLIGYIMNAAGIEGTPAEEMPTPEDDEKPAARRNTPKEPVKPKIRDNQFMAIQERIKAGEDVLEQARKNFVLDRDQDEALVALTKAFIKK